MAKLQLDLREERFLYFSSHLHPSPQLYVAPQVAKEVRI